VSKRYLVASLGSAGDLYPSLAIATALARRGDAVEVLSSENHRGLVEAEGLRFSAILDARSHAQAQDHPLLWHPLHGFGVLWRYLAQRSLEPTFDLIRARTASSPVPLTVVASPLVLGARLAREVLPIRLVTTHTAPSGLRTHEGPMFIGGRTLPEGLPRLVRPVLWWALDHYKLEPLARPRIDEFLRRHGQPPAQGPIFHRWIHSPDTVVGLFPADFGPLPCDWPVPVHCTGFPLYQSTAERSAPAAELTPPQGPVAVVYTGSAVTSAAAQLRQWAHTLHRHGCDVTVIDPASPEDSRPRWTSRRWANLRGLLQRSDLVLHHGGIGTVAEALQAQVPQWIWPSGFDQFDNAWRTAKTLGIPAGSNRLDQRKGAQSLRAHLQTLRPQGRSRDQLVDRRNSFPAEALRAIDA
jgi:rhamnosyltransferase subunit B